MPGLPEVRPVIALATTMTLAAIVGIQFEANIQAAVVAGAAIFTAALRPHVLLFVQFFNLKLWWGCVFDFEN